MKNIIKTQWNDKAVKVALSASYMAGMSDRTLNLQITVEETTLLPSSFARGHIVKANADIINTVGGLPRYISKVLNEAARREQKRRSQPITTQLSFELPEH